MTDPQLIDVDAATTAVIKGVVPLDQLVPFFDRAFSTLASVIAAQGITMTGPAFARYYGPPTDTADLEVGFPTSAAVQPRDGVESGALPGGRVARLVHAGGFDTLGASWERLGGWIAAQGLTAGTDLWEVYVTEPSPDMDPADLRTELNWLVSP